MACLTALVLTYSDGDNTPFVTEAVARGLQSQGAAVTALSLAAAEAAEANPDAYDLLCLGSPCYQASLPGPVQRYLAQLERAGNPGPRGRGWAALALAYGSPFSTMDQAQEVGHVVTQALKRAGYEVRAVWRVAGVHGGPPKADGDRLGWLGNLQGQMYRQDLDAIEAQARELARTLQAEKEMT